MGLIVTNSVNTSIGASMTNVWGYVIFRTDTMLVDGIVKCDLKFYKSEADKDSGKEQVYPINENGKVVNCEIQVLPTDIVKQSGQSTMADVVTLFYNKVKTILVAEHGWTITIE